MRARLIMFVLSLGVTSCVSLFPDAVPDPDIFRLSETRLPQKVATSAPVILVEIPQMPKALRNNRVAITHGAQDVAYAAGARWAAPVPQMMAELLRDSLLLTTKLNVVSPIEGVHPRYALITEVRNFEVVYDQGPQTVPLGRVTVRAKLINRRGRTLIVQRHFAAKQRASENTLSAMVAAVDLAAHDASRELGEWAAEQLIEVESELGSELN